MDQLEILIQVHIFAHFWVNFLALKLTATCNISKGWVVTVFLVALTHIPTHRFITARTRVRILDFTVVAHRTRTKIRPDFSKKVILKLKLPKNHFNKKCAPKLLFFNEKKVGKIAWFFDTDSDIENSLWKSNFCTLRRGGKAKGQLISKGPTMIPQVDLFSFVFWKNLKTPKRHFKGKASWDAYDRGGWLIL